MFGLITLILVTIFAVWWGCHQQDKADKYQLLARSHYDDLENARNMLKDQDARLRGTLQQKNETIAKAGLKLLDLQKQLDEAKEEAEKQQSSKMRMVARKRWRG